MTDLPHFALPFRFEGSHVAVTEQGALDEVGGCVEAIVRTRVGERGTLTGFGIPDLAFETNDDFRRAALSSAVDEYEPRARPLVEAVLPTGDDAEDELVSRLQLLVAVQNRSEEGA